MRPASAPQPPALLQHSLSEKPEAPCSEHITTEADLNECMNIFINLSLLLCGFQWGGEKRQNQYNNENTIHIPRSLSLPLSYQCVTAGLVTAGRVGPGAAAWGFPGSLHQNNASEGGLDESWRDRERQREINYNDRTIFTVLSTKKWRKLWMLVSLSVRAVPLCPFDSFLDTWSTIIKKKYTHICNIIIDIHTLYYSFSKFSKRRYR